MLRIKYLVMALLFSIFIIGCSYKTDNNVPINSDISIDNEFENKLVYNIDDSIPIEDYQEDCKNRWWTFNQCGSICWPDAEICAQVCWYTCEFLTWSTSQNSFSWTNDTDLPLKVASWFTLSIFADWLSSARDIVWPDMMWNYWVSRTGEGVITLLTIWENWEVESKDDIFKNLNNPHWLVLDPEDNLSLYYAEENKIMKALLYTDAIPETIATLPDWGRHFTRSLLFWPDWKIYISIWSACDVCYEENEMHGTIYSMNKDWSDFKEFATWLRNSVFMDTNPINWEIWATEMWRDNLWDNTPPDEINIIKEWNDYGWPVCYWKNIHDTKFDSEWWENACEDKTPSHIDLQAHSAPLWLSFVPEEWWPEEYWNDLLVAFHWSWNRTEPTWYKIVHIKLNDLWEFQDSEDFIYWWLGENEEKHWRPVDILTLPGWTAYITDDEVWVVYKVVYNNPSFKYIVEQDFLDEDLWIKGKIQVSESNEILINWEARWQWYFEWIFSIDLLDWNDTEITSTQANAQGEWTTSDYVPFTAWLKFDEIDTNNASIILRNANPSGLPENQITKKITIPLK